MINDVDDSEVIRQCLWAAVDGPFFPDWVFHTLIGLDRNEVRRIAESWPDWEDEDEQNLAINNALNNLLGYPHNRWDVWHDYISATGPELCGVYARFRGEPLDLSTKGYCERMS
ncbi:hypothetical protein [Mycobacterium sp. NPDC004974]